MKKQNYKAKNTPIKTLKDLLWACVCIYLVFLLGDNKLLSDIFLFSGCVVLILLYLFKIRKKELDNKTIDLYTGSIGLFSGLIFALFFCNQNNESIFHFFVTFLFMLLISISVICIQELVFKNKKHFTNKNTSKLAITLIIPSFSVLGFFLFRFLKGSAATHFIYTIIPLIIWFGFLFFYLCIIKAKSR